MFRQRSFKLHLMVEKFAALMKHLLALMIGSIAVLLLLEIEAVFFYLVLCSAVPDSRLWSPLELWVLQISKFLFCWSFVESDWDRRSFFRPLMLKEFFFLCIRFHGNLVQRPWSHLVFCFGAGAGCPTLLDEKFPSINAGKHLQSFSIRLSSHSLAKHTSCNQEVVGSNLAVARLFSTSSSFIFLAWISGAAWMMWTLFRFPL